MASETIVRQLRELCAEILARPVESLVARPEWGAINFETAELDLVSARDICQYLSELPVEKLPEGAAKQIFDSGASLYDTIKTIEKFSLNTSANPGQQRNQISQQLHAQAEAFYTNAQNWIPFLAYQRGDIQAQIGQLKSLIGDASSLYSNAKAQAEEKTTELDGVIAAAREASATVGVGHFTSDFSNEASELDRGAKKWLIATIASAILTVGSAVLMLFHHIDASSTAAQAVQWITTKLLILGVLFSATAWCGRIYKATKHQVVTNRQRANALKTFQAFAKAATDEATKNAVLLETTRSIFAMTPTGYIDSADSGSDFGGLKVLEVVKNATQATHS